MMYEVNHEDLIWVFRCPRRQFQCKFSFENHMVRNYIIMRDKENWQTFKKFGHIKNETSLCVWLILGDGLAEAEDL